MSVESLRGQGLINNDVQQATTPTSKQTSAASSNGVAFLTPPPSPHTQRSEPPTPTPPGPSLSKKETLPTPDASPSSVARRGRATQPKSLGQDLSRDPSQEAKNPSSDNPGNLARSRTPSAAPRAQARPVRPRPSNRHVRSTLELIEQVCDTKYKRRNGEFYRERKLLPNEYRQLLSQVNEFEDDDELKKYFYDKLRFNYTAANKTFSIRMISACHEALIQSYTALINDWLNLVKAGSVESDGRRCPTSTSRVTKSVRGTGSAAIEFGSRKGTYGPDQSYTFEDADFPSLVLEIAWSQTDDDLRRKARNYITWSKGAVRTVIAVSLNDIYTRIDNLSKTRKIREEDLNRGAAKFFIYRSDLSTARTGEVLAGEDQIVRDVTGNLVSGTELRLSLEDFIPPDEVRETDGLENPELIVTAEQLLDDTKYALRRQWRSMNKRKVTGTSPSPVAEARRHFPRMSRELKSLGSAIIPSRLRSGRQ